MRRIGTWAALLITLLSLAPLPTHAAAQQTDGLQISPVRSELKVDPGGSTGSDIVVANLTKQSLDITLFFREFSVTNTDYDYSFQVSHYDWITISKPELTLAPGQSKTIPFALNPSKDAGPGGYYFTIFASSNVSSGGVDSTIQAASLLYVTVNGTLVQSSKLDSADLPTFIFSPDVTYSFDMTDTGNVYYSIYSIAKLSNIFDTSEGDVAAHTVIPQKQRHLTGTLPSPRFPGIYTATIGYKTDAGQTVTMVKPVVYLPLWSIVVSIGLAFVVYKVIRRIVKRRRVRKTPSITD